MVVKQVGIFLVTTQLILQVIQLIILGKLGGFHCLCVDVGTISGHALTNYIAGDILPRSCWDLKHKPRSEPEGYGSKLGWCMG